jgi:hypothetical protein
MNEIKEYLAFKKFIMPYALQFLFWAGIGGTLYGTWWLYTHDNWAWMASLVFGTLMTRLIFESFIIKYQTYICLTKIKANIDAKY